MASSSSVRKNKTQTSVRLLSYSQPKAFKVSSIIGKNTPHCVIMLKLAGPWSVFFFGGLKITISRAPSYPLNSLKRAVIHKQWRTSPYQCLLTLGALGCSCCLFPTGRMSLLPRRKPIRHQSALECERIRRQPAQKGAQLVVNANPTRLTRVAPEGNAPPGSLYLDDDDAKQISDPARRLLVPVVSQAQLSVAVVAPAEDLKTVEVSVNHVLS